MKKLLHEFLPTGWNHVVALIGGLGCLVSAACLSPGTNFRVPNGESSWRLVFEDDSLGWTEKRAMAKDYLGILAQLEPRGSTGTGDSRWMEWTSEKRWEPHAACHKIGRLSVTVDGEEVAVVSKELSDAYRNAFAIGKKHADAYGCLPAFVRKLNRLAVDELPASFDELFWWPERHRSHGTKFFEEAGLENLVRELYGKWEYAEGSILDWTEEEGRPSAALRVKSVRDDSNGTVKFGLYPVVFDDGRWKLVGTDFGASC